MNGLQVVNKTVVAMDSILIVIVDKDSIRRVQGAL